MMINLGDRRSTLSVSNRKSSVTKVKFSTSAVSATFWGYRRLHGLLDGQFVQYLVKFG
jgi:hypothetical protein